MKSKINLNHALVDYTQPIQNHIFINKIIVESNLDLKFKCRSLLVHESITNKFLKILEKFNLLDCSEGYWDFTLCIRQKIFPMKLFWFPNITDAQCEILSKLIKNAQFSFVWEDNVVLYRPLDVFNNDLQSFINGKHMSKFIQNIDIVPSISYTEKSITVIEFTKNVSKSLIDDYKDYFNAIQSNTCIFHDHKSIAFYYVTYPLAYLVPDYLKFLAKPFNNPNAFNQINLLFEYGRYMAKKNYELFNIIDLCQMKLAIDDARFEYENCEFLKLINQKLCKMAKEQLYLNDRAFNLPLYCIDKGIIDVPDETLQYFVHNFQSHFDYIIKDMQRIKSVHLSNVSSIENLFIFLRKNEHFPVSINGIRYRAMSPELFLKLIKYGGTFLQRIILDTNFEWPSETDCVQHDRLDITQKLTIQFVGENKTYFIENFINWLKFRFGLNFENLELCFWKTSIIHPFVMNMLNFNTITVHQVVLTTSLLGILKRVVLQSFGASECSLHKDHATIKLLEDLDQPEKITLIEEEHTLETIFKHISSELTSGNCCSNAYRFKRNIVIYPKRIELTNFIFRISADGFQIEIYDTKMKRVIDIYEFLKFEISKSSRDEFEFYK